MSDIHTNLMLPSNPCHVSQIEPFVDKLAQEMHIGPEMHGNILISLTEAVSNAMLHGNGGDQSKTVSISLRRQKDAVAIRVSDQGSGFNPSKVPDPTSQECIEECGGRGIFLMRNLADECKFSKNGSTVEMRFKF